METQLMVQGIQLQLNTSLKLCLLVILMVVAVANVTAVTATSEQIEQFMQLPRDQQERIAEQMGIDVDAVKEANTTPPAISVPRPVPQFRATGPEYKSSSSAESDDLEDKYKAPKLKMYGYDLFENNSGAFSSNLDVPIPADYVIGPGDSIVVQLYGKENASYTFNVSREGLVHFPEIGPVTLAGLTFSQVQDMINQMVSERMIGVRSSVSMGAIRSIRVFVLGEAAKPGSFIVSSLSTMTNAIFASGGITKIGSLRNIQLKRKGQLITTLDLYDLLLKGDTKNDANLMPGDVIFIPPIGPTVSVDGEVRRPAIYELKKESTVNELLTLSGGLLPTAYPPASKIERITDDGGRTVLDVNLSIQNGMSTRLRPADKVIVKSILESLENVVELSGYVDRPGILTWRPGMRVSDVIPSIRDLNPNPDLKIALIQREILPVQTITVLAFNLGDALSNPDSPSNIILQPRDKVIVFGFKQNRSEISDIQHIKELLSLQSSRDAPQRIVKVFGNVRFPGSYPFTENMTAQQLLDLAGGLSENAYGLNVEINHYNDNEEKLESVEYEIVDLAQANKFKLRAGDAAFVRKSPEWGQEEFIDVAGEVKFPGRYMIRKGETLEQVVARAGGLTDAAYADGAIFTRIQLQELESQRLKDLKQRIESDIAASNIEEQSEDQKVDVDDARQLLASIEAVKPLGRMVIDLQKQLHKQDIEPIYVLDGDRLVVPRFKQSVTVVGEVQFPTSHLYDEQFDVSEYIDRSGGMSAKADKSHVYVVKANGRVFLPGSSSWFRRDRGEIAAGDTIVVPIDPDRIKSLTLWTNVSEIFYQIALGAAAVASF